MSAAKRDGLVVPPKKWRNAASLRAYAGVLKGAIAVSDCGFSYNNSFVEIGPKTARALLEIVCQAIHTEQGSGS